MPKKEITYIEADKTYVFECPHCDMMIQVGIQEVQCKIFRHGAMKTNTKDQINPHTPEKECDRLKENDLIYGCGKPFCIKDMYAEECDYI
jgi:hypothetical protein